MTRTDVVKLQSCRFRNNQLKCFCQLLVTILSEAEDNRPLLTMDSTSPDGATALMPGHFLVGRPLLAPPLKVDHNSALPLLRRWTLVRRLISELWMRWCKEYLESLQAHH